uniref:Probable protein-export membrane protein SecG n=1 Tax=Storeatula sp. CCMP1868 TaxID=195070 RepID=A0A222AHV2_9CRYP|nr:preprotein translocase SecG subunit [Storeatula sp. CCMP1868]
MIQNLWILCSVFLIISIMIHNPKGQGMSGQNQILNGTRSAEETLNKVTWILITVFFLLTVYLATLNKID